MQKLKDLHQLYHLNMATITTNTHTQSKNNNNYRQEEEEGKRKRTKNNYNKNIRVKDELRHPLFQFFISVQNGIVTHSSSYDGNSCMQVMAKVDGAQH